MHANYRAVFEKMDEFLSSSFVAVNSFASTASNYVGLEPHSTALVIGQRIVDAERIVDSLKLSDLRVSVSAYHRRGISGISAISSSTACGNDEVLVRPRILPALKTSSLSGIAHVLNGYQVLKSASRRRKTVQPVSSSIPASDNEEQTTVTEPGRLTDIPLEILNSGAIFCPGCRDINGRPVLIATCRATRDSAPCVWHRANVVCLARLTLYCCCNSCCCGGSSNATIGRARRLQTGNDNVNHVTLIIDTRTAGLNALDALAEVMHVVEASRPGCFGTVYVIVDKVTEAVLSQASLFPQQALTKVELLDDDELCKYVDINSLPAELGGTSAVSLSRWTDYQLKLDSFVTECYDAAARLMSATEEITRVDTLPCTVFESKLSIERHESHVRNTLELPQIRRLLENGESVLLELSNTVTDMGSRILFSESVDAAAKLYRQVYNGFHRLVNIAKQRLVKLEQCLQLRQFEESASTIINWLCTEGEDVLTRHASLADNLRAIETQWIDLEKFSAIAKVHIEASAGVLDEATMLTQLGVCDQTTGAREICRELKSRVSAFTTRLTYTRMIVESALQCYRSLDQIYEWALDTMKLIDTVRRQRSLSRSDIERCLIELDNCASRRPELIDFNPGVKSESNCHNVATNRQIPRCTSSPLHSSNASFDRLTERCRLAATRRTETDDHLSLCRAALRDALHRLIVADSANSPFRTPTATDSTGVIPLQVMKNSDDVLTSSVVLSQRRQTPSSSGFAGSEMQSSRLLMSSSSSLSSSVLLPVADLGASMGTLITVSTSPAFDVSDYMLDTVTAQCDSKTFADDSCNEIGAENDINEQTECRDDVADAAASTDTGVENVRESDELNFSSSRTCLADSLPLLTITTSTPAKSIATQSNENVVFETGPSSDNDEFIRENSYATLPEPNSTDSVGIPNINRSASSVLFGSLSSSILAIASSSISLASSPVRPSSASGTVSASRASVSSLSAGGSDRSSKRLRQRWKQFRKAISMIVDGNRKPDDFVISPVDQAGELQDEATEQQNDLSAEDGSAESLPGSFVNETVTCIANDSTGRESPGGGDTMRCKYGWMATPGESNGGQQLVYTNRHALPSRSSSATDLRSIENEARRNRVLLLVMQELVQTERDYVRALQYVIDNYIPEIMRESVPQQLRGMKSVIFENIEKIYDFHNRTFLAKVEKCVNSPYQLGSCFLQHESDFYLYALYNKNKPKSDELMMEFGAQYFKAKQMELNDRMDLSSYLLKPVQRLGKYALLLAQITDECPTTHPDYADLKAALEMTRFQLRHGNDLLAMDCIQSCDVNLQEQGMLLRQAEFVVLNGRKKCLRHVFLFEELVLFSKTRHSPTGSDVYIYKHSMKTTDIGLTEKVGDSGDTFELWFRKRTAGSTFALKTSSVHVHADWVRDISRLLWKQTMRNRERRLAEMACLGVGNKPSLDLKPSDDNINDRFINVPAVHRGIRLRTSIPSSSMTSRDHQLRNGYKRPHSLVSVSSSSSSGSGLSASGLLNSLLRHGYSTVATLQSPAAIQLTASAVSDANSTVTSTTGSMIVPLSLGLAHGGALSTMHESPLELITESGTLVIKEDVAEDDCDKSSLLQEIDNHLSAMAKDTQSSSSNSTPYDTAASDSENADLPDGVNAMAADSATDDNSVFEEAETECETFDDNEAEEFRLFTSDTLMQTACNSSPIQLPVAQACLADINLL